MRDGKEGFIEFFTPFLKRTPIRNIQLIRTIEDGKIIEHWDVQEQIRPEETWNNSGKF